MKLTFRLFVLASLVATSALFAVSPVYTQVAGVDAPMKSEVVIGVVLYKMDGGTWDIGEYQRRLEVDTWMLPSRSPMTRYPGYTVQTKFSHPIRVVVEETSTEAEQIAALETLVANGVDGIVFAPISGSDALKAAITDVMSQDVPVVLVWRDLPLVNKMGLKGYVGADAFRAGWSMAMARIYRNFPEDAKFGILMSDANDPLQIGLADGVKFAIGDYLADVRVASGDGYAEFKQMIADFPTMNTLFFTDGMALSEGVARAKDEAEENISVAGWAVPEDWENLITTGKIKGVGRVDIYEMLVRATCMVKEFLTHFEPLSDLYSTLEVYRGMMVIGYVNRAYTSHPYPYYRGIQGMW